MIFLWLFILLLSMALLVHSYWLFPAWMMQASKKKIDWKTDQKELQVAVLVAAYNEENVISEKIRSTLDTNYPKEFLEIWIGSDASTDQTNEIVAEYAKNYPEVKFKPFEERTGKPEILNDLVKHTDAEILVLTDADTFFDQNTIPELVKPFSDPKIGGVQANLQSLTDKNDEVAEQEQLYNEREFMIKKGESYYGAVIGAYGACYAMRKSLYKPIPAGFYVDDFFLFMNILLNGYKTVFTPNAVCKMEVSGNSNVQFKRKVRISSGNFQNLLYFRKLINPFRNFAGFAFFSHKVIRWLGPFLMLLILITNLVVLPVHPFFTWLLSAQLLFYLLGLLDVVLRRLDVDFIILRYISHFVLMNYALLIGFFRFLSLESDGKWEH